MKINDDALPDNGRERMMAQDFRTAAMGFSLFRFGFDSSCIRRRMIYFADHDLICDNGFVIFIQTQQIHLNTCELILNCRY